MSKNKSLILVIVLAITCSIIIGFTISSYTNNKQNNIPAIQNIALNMVGYSYTNAEIAPLIASYEKTHPTITINYTQIAPSKYETYIFDRFHRYGTGILTPDIFEARNTDQNKFLQYSHLAPLSIISKNIFNATYYPLYARGLIYQNALVIGLPNDMQPLIIAYNKSFFTSNNIYPSEFTSNHNDFDAKVHTIAGKYKINSININDPVNSIAAGDILQLFMLSNKTQMNDTGGKRAAFNNTQGLQALAYYNLFLAGGDYDAGGNNISEENDLSSFANGRTIMNFLYPETIAKIKLINPAIQIGYFVYPAFTTPVALAQYNYDTVYAKSAHSTDAWNFLTYLHTDSSLSTIASLRLTENGYGLVFPRKDMPVQLIDLSLSNALNTAAPIAKDWNNEDQKYSEKEFGDIITNVEHGTIDASAALQLAQDKINANIAKSFNL